MRALTIAATGMSAQERNIEVIANNVANINTTGFKRSRAEFTDLIYQNERLMGVASRGRDDSGRRADRAWRAHRGDSHRTSSGYLNEHRQHARLGVEWTRLVSDHDAGGRHGLYPRRRVQHE